LTSLGISIKGNHRAALFVNISPATDALIFIADQCVLAIRVDAYFSNGVALLAAEIRLMNEVLADLFLKFLELWWIIAHIIFYYALSKQ
jgi:hypothetical protein